MREANDSKTTTLSAAGAGMADNYGGSSRSPLPSASSPLPPSPVDNGKRSSSVTTLPSLEESTPTKDTHSGESEGPSPQLWRWTEILVLLALLVVMLTLQFCMKPLLRLGEKIPCLFLIPLIWGKLGKPGLELPHFWLVADNWIGSFLISIEPPAVRLKGVMGYGRWWANIFLLFWKVWN